MRVHRLQTRIIVLFVALLALVQFAAFWFVNAANSRNAGQKVEQELILGERVFARVLEQSSEKLAQSARVLAADFAFRQAIGTHDTATIASALENHGARIGADAMLFVGLDRNVVWDTLHPGASARPFEFPALLAASRNASPVGLHVLKGHAYQLVAVPVLAPVTIGWVVMGFEVNDALARDLSQLTGLDVSFAFQRDAGQWQLLASTADKREQPELLRRVFEGASRDGTRIVVVGGIDYQTRVIPLGHGATGSREVVAILDRSLAGALAAFDRLRTTLFVIAMLSLLASVAGSIAVARNITRPLNALATVATNIERGDYSGEVRVERSDEIGVLASSLNHMKSAIADRERHILKLAYEDPLTDLANRSRFTADLQRSLTQAQGEGSELAILVMDLDRFKYVNDTLGHSVGDHVLRDVARRLLEVVATAECVARLGGDEFALLLKGSPGFDAADTARAIINALEQPIHYEGQPLDVGTSIGIASFPLHGSDAQTLVRNADIAMYVAKRNKSGFAVYDPNYDSSQQEHLSLLGELRRAVENDELLLYYQPKVSLRSTNVSAVEALIRWEHPARGLISPALFIPFAEHTGYIKVLTRWVMREAIRQCGAWLRDGLRLQVAINISVRDLLNRDLPDQVASLLKEHDVPPNLICLEITESGFMEDPAHAQKVLDRLAALGLQLSIDDYGTGYSSLSYIMQLPVQELKIDRSFISRMVGNADISTIVRSTIELGHNLGLTVVAEGVEDAASWAMLEALGCDDAQGYFMSRPLSAAALKDWMTKVDGAFTAPVTGTSTQKVLSAQLGNQR